MQVFAETALEVSDDGKTGRLYQRRGSPQGHEHAFLGETAEAPFLASYLTERGAVVPEGWDLTVASLSSADGTAVYGWGFNPDNLVEMFKVELK